MSSPLLAVIAELKQTPDSAVPVLRTLHEESAAIASLSKVDLRHLTSRTIALIHKHERHAIWCGSSIAHVLVECPAVLTSEAGALFAALLKAWDRVGRNTTVARAVAECLNRLCDKIRGKPTLTREVLTPHLGALLAAYCLRMEEFPDVLVPALQTLVREHPTTSRPYANKIRARLLAFVAESRFVTCPEAVRAAVCALLATLALVEKDGPEKMWAQDVARILATTARTLAVYASFLAVGEDEDATRVLRDLAALDPADIFPPLSIDINSPASILALLTRVDLLLQLLRGYLFLRTSYTVAVPLGQVLGLLDACFAINTRYVPFRREVRDAAARHYVSLALARTHEAALGVLGALPAYFSSALVPHLSRVLVAVELLVFLDHNRIDAERTFAHEVLACAIVRTASCYLALTAFVGDFSSLSRVVDLAMFLVEPRARPASQHKAQSPACAPAHSRAARKSAKKGGSAAIADLLSHENLFRRNVPAETRRVVLDFFATVIPRCLIFPTQYNKLVKFVVCDAVQWTHRAKFAAVPSAVRNVLEAVLMHPGASAASIYAIAASLAVSPVLSVVQNPRFPPLPVVPRAVSDDTDLESDDDAEPPAKKQRVELPTPVPVTSVAVGLVEQQVQETPEHMIFREKRDPEFEKETEKEIDVPAAVPSEKPAEVAEIAKVAEGEIAEEVPSLNTKPVLYGESDDGSEIEIPELDMESDSDNE